MLKTIWHLLKDSPEYVSALVIITFFSIGFMIGDYIKYGGTS